MKNIAILISITLPLLSNAEDYHSCTSSPPGIESQRLDTPNEIILRRIKLGPNGQEGILATEYIGSKNLQTSIYIKNNNKYCLIGDLGGTTAVKTSPQKQNNKLYSITTKSASGPYQFTRIYEYKTDRYIKTNCFIQEEGKSRRRCKNLED